VYKNTLVVFIFSIDLTFGLFGLTLFVSRSRTKEIGIKKVFGSSEESIVYEFLRENFILISIASISSIPVTFYIITKWLNNFAYKVNISWLLFILTYLLAIAVVILTVLFHSYKASRTNPVTALKYE
jgi:putative ABC transport system permease protein